VYYFLLVCKRDDSNFTQDDLNSLKNSCLAAPEMKIIVTHGTETLIKTAQFLALESELEQNKLIILTGSFVPHQFKNSDAEFNIGLAVGIYVLRKFIYLKIS
jgi:L-asparaginase